jgi:hypothetical protein
MERMLRLLACATGVLAIAAAPPRSPRSAGARAAPLAGIDVSLRLDPRITKGLYMGDRWVAPTGYSRVQDGKRKLVVEARAFGLDARRHPIPIAAKWAAADARIVTVSSGDGHEVTLTVRRAGETSLTVTYGPFSRTLAVRALKHGGKMRVDISHDSANGIAAGPPHAMASSGSGAR